jgi:hypothetical protein
MDPTQGAPSQVPNGIVALQYLTQGGDPTKALEQLFSALSTEQRQLLQSHMQQEAMKFEQTQQAPVALPSTSQAPFDMPALSFASTMSDSSAFNMMASNPCFEQQHGFFNSNGIIPENPAADCLDHLFEIAANPDQYGIIPLRERNLPASFFHRPKTELPKHETSPEMRGDASPPAMSDTSKGSSKQRRASRTKPYRTPSMPVSRGQVAPRIRKRHSISTPNISAESPSLVRRLPPGWRASSTPDGVVFYVK